MGVRSEGEDCRKGERMGEEDLFWPGWSNRSSRILPFIHSQAETPYYSSGKGREG